MTTSTTSDVITVLTAEQLFCVIKRFPRVWFSLISTNPYVCYEVPVPSEAVSFDHDNGMANDLCRDGYRAICRRFL